MRPAGIKAKNIFNKFCEIWKFDLNLTSELENVAQGHVSSIYAAIELKYGMRPAGIKLKTISNKFCKLLKFCLNLTSELRPHLIFQLSVLNFISETIQHLLS